jgi:hypothetical protein
MAYIVSIYLHFWLIMDHSRSHVNIFFVFLNFTFRFFLQIFSTCQLSLAEAVCPTCPDCSSQNLDKQIMSCVVWLTVSKLLVDQSFNIFFVISARLLGTALKHVPGQWPWRPYKLTNIFSLFSPAMQHGVGQWAWWPHKSVTNYYNPYPPAMQHDTGIGQWAWWPHKM